MKSSSFDPVSNNNLANWLSGGPRRRELKETRQRWETTERQWRASPFARTPISEFVVSIVREAMDAAERVPALPILVALAEATEELLYKEDITALEADWPLIESDMAIALDVRQMLTRRHRWVADTDRMLAIVRRQCLAAFCALFRMLPETCFESWDGQSNEWFEVPLASLVERPAEAIETLWILPYADDALKFDLFLKLRERLITNMLVASGFSPTANPHDVGDRLVPPTQHKVRDAQELAEIYLGGTPFGPLLQLPIPFRVPDAMRFEHCHIVGGTGHGKTQLMQRMIYADLVAAVEDGRSVVVIDSQGDLINKLVRLELFSPTAPGNLCDRLVLIDPADVEFPASLNLFAAHTERIEGYRPVDRERVLNGVVELYETFFGALLGAELTQKQGVIFRYLARLMLNIPDATIHTLMQLMEDGRPFKPHMDTLDGSARYFFEKEFFHPSFAATKKQILKRLWGVLSTPAFERMFAQKANKLDLFTALNDGRIILVNTAKDLLKEEGSQLFGRFFIAMLSQAALERSTVPEQARTPTFVYVDEAQEYFDDSIETILNQARKFRVSITAAHQTLDQLSVRLRSAFLSNTSLKCAGGVSSRDAHALAPELHTTADFIESMRRRGGQTEFAVWLKQRTATALRLSVPLGFLERQPTLTDEAYDALIATNRTRYCGTLDDVLQMTITSEDDEPVRRKTRQLPTEPSKVEMDAVRSPTSSYTDPPISPPTPLPEAPAVARPVRAPVDTRELGKGGPKHRYLQTLVKGLAEQQGFQAIIEAPVPNGPGQVDVLLKRDAITIAVEISITTPVEAERENVRKCLAAGFGRVALVLGKSNVTQGRYRSAIIEGLSTDDRERVTFLSPEEVPDFIAGLAPPPAPSESVVRGYKVKVSRTAVSPEDARARRDMLAKVVARSLTNSPTEAFTKRVIR